jgi:2-methylcitrate dehydratase PrpD
MGFCRKTSRPRIVGMEVAKFIHETTWDDLSRPVQAQAVRCLLDTVGAAVAGRATDLSRIIHDFAADAFTGSGASLWQDGRAVSPPGAALANGMTIDALDVHDGHPLTKGHAGAAVVPAAVAVLHLADQPVSGKELLTSLAVGYEVALRAGIALHGTACDYHTSGAWNALGCAALTARRLRLAAEPTLHALGIAEYHGPRSPMLRCVEHPTMLKDGSGWGAMAGVSAALLAGQGFTGRPAQTVEGEGVRPYWEGLGRDWQFLKQYFKPHAVCRWTQPALEGAVRLQEQHGFAAEEVTAVRVATFREATHLAVRKPANTEEAQYSLPFPVAAALVHGTLGPDQLTGAALRDARVLRLAERVELKEDPDLSRQFPARRFAHVTVETESGARFEIRHAEPRWDAEAPPTLDELRSKFRRLTKGVSPDAAGELEGTILNCAELPDASPLADQLACLR